MNKIFFLFTLAAFLIAANVSPANDGLDKFRTSENSLKQRLEKDLKLAQKEHAYKTGKFVDFYVDLQLGYGFTGASIDRGTNANGDFTTDSKGGFTTGALFFLNILDEFKFSSGLSFINKKFEVNPPSVVTPTPGSAIDTATSQVSNNYINIPMNFNFGGMITDEFGLMFNGGPYLGFLISSDDKAGLGYKNFDLGLNGTLTANYLVGPLTSVILGTRFEYGGLNNLGKTDYVNKITTNNFSIFSGIRLAI